METAQDQIRNPDSDVFADDWRPADRGQWRPAPAIRLDIPAVFRAGAISSLRVVKLGYSRDPWRIVLPDGQELGERRAYPGGGMPPYEAPLAYARQRDALAALDQLR
jgi:hypothetical protein